MATYNIKDFKSTSVDKSLANSITSYGTITELSSIEHKENLNVLTDSLSKISNITGFSYNKKGSSNIEIGLIAEEVAKVIPEVVTYNKDGKPLGIQYTKIIAHLIEAIKTLKAEINDLKGNS